MHKLFTYNAFGSELFVNPSIECALTTVLKVSVVCSEPQILRYYRKFQRTKVLQHRMCQFKIYVQYIRN